MQMQVPHLFRKCNDVFKVIEEANAGEIVAVFNAPGSYSCHSRRNVFRETAPM
ncbi:hypothetical protein MtrunA17_Chr2g0311051 [Medicago truncatula]|uniref:Uncharacterized protein n=1 Tax=Medicago truncatula TaxID=3880 RepID=A0A396JDK4_MEDTR|nr:hypothetical protein MtrunA17_Chr2g0310871 [Medicago truncatula]RHN74483.1 hypothetical protein MtrunA17_Chr2g0310921 [Medicago truncatula]RHN74489.1 hypothetical protein MtrunA17_Chr2g0310981 [Medicago truncatula]RHN74496.1 hypothetical protein MtrunA17_Chr2g0311051 [Medicago truncatula]